MTRNPDWTNSLAPPIAIALLAAVQYHHSRKLRAPTFVMGLEASFSQGRSGHSIVSGNLQGP